MLVKLLSMMVTDVVWLATKKSAFGDSRLGSLGTPARTPAVDSAPSDDHAHSCRSDGWLQLDTRGVHVAYITPCAEVDVVLGSLQPGNDSSPVKPPACATRLLPM